MAAGWIISNPWIKAFGALYLVYLMCSHLSADEDEGEEGAELRQRGLWMTVLQIELMDLSLSVDNVVAAVILSPNLWVVCAGVFIGILVLRFLAGFCIRLLQRFPILARTAFVLVGMVGGLLFFEMGTGKHVGHLGKFGVIVTTLGASFVYGRSAWVQRGVGPLLRPVMAGMRGFAACCDGVFWPLKVLHRRLAQLLQRQPKTQKAPGNPTSGIPEA
jgi:predicted tellurium resistance membrane protein TerC